MDNQKNLIRFFPFALTRIERLRDYLNRMYESGYQIVKIKFGLSSILLFAFQNKVQRGEIYD